MVSLVAIVFLWHWMFPTSKIHGANMGLIWVPSAPDGPHVCPMKFAIRVVIPKIPCVDIGHWGNWITRAHYCYGLVVVGRIHSAQTKVEDESTGKQWSKYKYPQFYSRIDPQQHCRSTQKKLLRASLLSIVKSILTYQVVCSEFSYLLQWYDHTCKMQFEYIQLHSALCYR